MLAAGLAACSRPTAPPAVGAPSASAAVVTPPTATALPATPPTASPPTATPPTATPLTGTPPTATTPPAASPAPGAATRPAGTSQDRAPAGQLHRELLAFRTGYQPKQVAFTPDGRQLWVTPLGSALGVEVYDPATGRLEHRIKLGQHGAVEVIFSRNGATAYVSQMETASVFAIDTHTYRVLRRYPTRGVWTKVMALSPDERTLYASNWESDDVSAITLETGAVRRYPTVRTPRGLYAAPDGRTLYVAGYAAGEIERLDLRTGRGRTLLRTGGAMRHLVADPERRRLYANDMASDTTYVVDLGTDRVRRLARTDRLPNTTDLSPDGRVLYLSHRGRNGRTYLAKGPEWGSVVVLDALTGQPLDAIVGGNQTTALDVSPDGRRLAFSDFLDSRVRIYEILPYEVLRAGRGGHYPAHRAELKK